MDFLGVINIILTVASVICTGVSIYSAFKSKGYYKNSKNLVSYKNINIAYIECETIMGIFTKLLVLSNPQLNRGKNIHREVANHGRNMKNSINKIRENMYEKDFKEVKQLLDSKEKEIERYIDSLISGKGVVNNIFFANDDFNMCQKNIVKIQELIKDRLDVISEKLK